jgi:hypothetical protein
MAPPTPTTGFLPSYFDALFARHPNQRWAETKRELLVHINADRPTATLVLEGARLWTPALGGLTLRQVSSAEIADVRVAFSKKVLGDAGLGESQVTFEVPGDDPRIGDGIIVGAQVTLKAGLSATLLRLTAAHEFGHVFGLVGRAAGLPAHSPDRRDLMSPIVRTRSALTQRDINTLARLYSLPRPAPRATNRKRVTVSVRLTRRGCR